MKRTFSRELIQKRFDKTLLIALFNYSAVYSLKQEKVSTLIGHMQLQ
jgi:hypothetical protein